MEAIGIPSVAYWLSCRLWSRVSCTSGVKRGVFDGELSKRRVSGSCQQLFSYLGSWLVEHPGNRRGSE